MIYFLNEDGNSKLKKKKFPLSKGIRKYLQDTLDNFKDTRNDFDVEGWKRLNNILDMTDGIEYSEMKRLKNFFDTYAGDGKDDEFKLNGGMPMKNWVNNTLKTATDTAEGIKQAEEFLRKTLDDGKPQVKKERRTTTKSIEGPTKITISSVSPSLGVENNTIIKYDSVAQTPSVSENKIIRITESQMRLLTK